MTENTKKIVFMGDSLTVNFKQLDNYECIINLAVGGYKTTENIPLVKDLRNHHPNKVFLMVGINDLLCNLRFWPHGYTIPINKSYDLLIDLIKTNLPKATTYLMSVLPVNLGLLNEDYKNKANQMVRLLNQNIQETAKKYFVEYLDLTMAFIDSKQELNTEYTKDGIHLNDKGYQVWFDCIKALL